MSAEKKERMVMVTTRIGQKQAKEAGSQNHQAKTEQETEGGSK